MPSRWRTLRINYRSTADLADAVEQLSGTIPRDIDVVVGVPRSGMLPATMLALRLDLPLTDLGGLIEGRLLSAGSRARDARSPDVLRQRRHVLIVDDSLATGAAMQGVHRQLEAHPVDHAISTAVVYVRPEGRHQVDFYAEAVHSPRIFQWNALSHSILKSSCVDLDGVLCEDPEPGSDDDGPRYQAFLRGAKVKAIPRWPIGWIVTSRLERYRPETEGWLRENGIQFSNLVMLDHETAASRRSTRIAAAYKASVYRETQAALFVESSIKQSTEIAFYAKADVFCVDTMDMVRYDRGKRGSSTGRAREMNRHSGSAKAIAKASLPSGAYRSLSKISRRWM